MLRTRKLVSARLRAGMLRLAAAHGERIIDCPHNPISLALTLSRICGGAGDGDGRGGSGGGGGDGGGGADGSAGAASQGQAGSDCGGDGGGSGGELPAGAETGGGSGSGGDCGSGTGGEDGGGTGGGGAGEGGAERATTASLGAPHRGVSGTRTVGVAPGRGAEPREIDGHAFPAYGAHADDYPEPYLTVAAAVGMSEADVDVLLRRLDDTIREYKAQAARG